MRNGSFQPAGDGPTERRALFRGSPQPYPNTFVDRERIHPAGHKVDERSWGQLPMMIEYRQPVLDISFADEIGPSAPFTQKYASRLCRHAGSDMCL